MQFQHIDQLLSAGHPGSRPCEPSVPSIPRSNSNPRMASKKKKTREKRKEKKERKKEKRRKREKTVCAFTRPSQLSSSCHLILISISRVSLCVVARLPASSLVHLHRRSFLCVDSLQMHVGPSLSSFLRGGEPVCAVSPPRDDVPSQGDELAIDRSKLGGPVDECEPTLQESRRMASSVAEQVEYRRTLQCRPCSRTTYRRRSRRRRLRLRRWRRDRSGLESTPTRW